jgi:hypothetical protein
MPHLFKTGSERSDQEPLLILDEAYHAAASSGQRYAIDSHITRAVRDLAPRFEHRLFLSATPHNGHSNSFSALLEILDPQRFCRGATDQGSELGMGLRPTHWDENGVELCVYADGAWTAKVCLHSG